MHKKCRKHLRSLRGSVGCATDGLQCCAQYADLLEKHLQLQKKEVWVEGLGIVHKGLLKDSYTMLPLASTMKGKPALFASFPPLLSNRQFYCFKAASPVSPDHTACHRGLAPDECLVQGLLTRVSKCPSGCNNCLP